MQRSLSDRTKTYFYSLQIREIIVSGDLAVVRLAWTLKVIPVGSTDEMVSEEPGIDIFRANDDPDRMVGILLRLRRHRR